MWVGELAKLAGVTIRTLHHYDKIGLLQPSSVTDAGYRDYTEADLATLQQILFFRELGFPLDVIRQIMQSPAYDREHALQAQREVLVRKRERLDGLIALIDQTMKGERKVSFDAFDASRIEEVRQKYAEEARERWGGTDAHAEYEEKAAGRTAAEEQETAAAGEAILRESVENRSLDPGSAAAQALVAKWQDFISANYYTCSKETLAGLGQMYTADERFMQNLDRHGDGTAAFMAAAIEVYAGQHSKKTAGTWRSFGLTAGSAACSGQVPYGPFSVRGWE